MAKHNELGKLGEELAVQFLVDKGYEILEKNWRNKHKEIDIVAKDGSELVIVEVKTREFQARLCGASAVLLIAACLTVQQCSSLLKTAHELGMEVLLEMHDEHELEYANLGADLCGINNRHLGSFVTDVETSFRLADRLRSECGCSTDMTATTSAPVLVSESGISNPKTVCELRDAGFRGFLIGETFMKTPDPGQALHDFINQICNMH